MERVKSYGSLLVKGVAMGAANVIPGVSGGTIAFITGIYETLIHSLKSLDIQALRLLLQGRFHAFVRHTNLYFLLAVFAGVGISLASLAKILEFLFVNYSVWTMAFFFGLILASVFSVGRSVHKWNASSVIMLMLGTAVAVGISFLNPAQENSNSFYIFVCGIVAVCSMILPGLSGSYILLIMGNYLLVLRAISSLQIDILIPLGLGCFFGLIAFSHFLSFIFRKFRDGTIALLTGFVFGSLLIIWPWKRTLYLLGSDGQPVLKEGGEKIETGFAHFWPPIDGEFALAALFVVVGVITILVIEGLGKQKESEAT